MRVARCFLAIMIMLACAAPAGAGSRTLHLNVGPVDTATRPNLKTAPPGAFRGETAYVVQFSSPITMQQRAALIKAGVALHDYLPDNAYIADLAAVRPADLSSIATLTWVGEFDSSWKLDPQLGQRHFTTPDRQAIAARGESAVIITLFAGRAAHQVVASLNSIAGAVIHRVDVIDDQAEIAATLPANSVAVLAQWPDVQYVEDAPELTLRNSTTRWIVQSNVLNVTPLYDHGITGVGQIVGVSDGKVNRDHCSFRDAVNNTPGPGHRKIQAYNTTFGYNQHGTHVAGTAIGQDVNGATDNTRGIAYGGRLVYSPIPSFTDAASYSMFSTAHSQGARVHTNSWGNDGTTSYDSLCRGVDRFSYDFEDSLVCFAVTNTSTLKNPENAKDLLAVGASGDTPAQTNFCAGTSGQGPTADGRRKPEIYAPGCATTSSSGSGTVCTTASLSGTSMASPAIAGVGLLVRQYYVDGYYPSGSPTPADSFTPTGALIKATLLNSSVDMTSIAGYPSNREGWGRVLADNGLYFPGDGRRLVILADLRNALGLSTGQVTNFNFTVAGAAEQLRVTLVWTEPAASASTGTGSAVVNDIDLEVTSPSAQLYLGNNFVGGVSATGGVKDAKNNVEQVHVNSPPTGQWTATVRGAAVAVGLQGYSLVVTGDVSVIAPCALLGDVNSDTKVDSLDIAGFVRAKLSLPAEAGEIQSCANYGSGTLDGDIGLFVDALVN